jgi:hypothetical protein
MKYGAFVIAALAACSPSDREAPRDAAVDAVDAQPDALDAYVDLCKVPPDPDDTVTCHEHAPAGSFEAEIQWTWMGPPGFTRSIVTPLVANLTDDNGDGAIDLCDTPDIVVVASPNSGQPGTPGRIFLLDGKTGAQELEIMTAVDATVTPALGDLDHDGVAEIVTVDHDGKILIFDHSGALKIGPAGQWAGSFNSGAIALADLDHDGEVEILAGNTVFDHEGVVKWTAPGTQAFAPATTAADLDGDGYMEVVLGSAAYHYDGTLYWDSGIGAGFPQVANLDGDPEPEILVTNQTGLSVLEHNGVIKYEDARPTPGITGLLTWIRPAAVHDFDGDGTAEYAMCSQFHFSVFNADSSIKWTTPVSDDTGIAGATAFDFLGDGSSEATFADEKTMFVFGPAGTPLFSIPRTSGTLIEYPVVADVDNDGSAEIVLVSNTYPGLPQAPTVQVIKDRLDRWMPARRIWNEHTYHVTNVREDGTIPRNEVPSWKRLNTFRTNAQRSGPFVCQPPPLR